MSMYCVKCGSRLDDITGLCPNGCNNPDQTGKAIIIQPHETPYMGGPGFEPEKSAKTGFMVALVIIGIILSGLICLFVLSYFDIVEVPVISDAVERIFSSGRSEDEDDATAADHFRSREPKTEIASFETATAFAEQISIPEGFYSFTGVLTAETYSAGGNREKVAYVLLPDTYTADDKDPDSAYDAVYLEVFRIGRIELLGDDFSKYVQKHITVHGYVSYASESDHRETFILTNCTVEITLYDERYNKGNEEPTTFSAADTRQVTVHLDDPDERLNIRSGPGFEYDVTDTVDNGTSMTLYSSQNGWSYVEYGGKKGWCNSSAAGFAAAQGTNGRQIIPISEVSCSSDQGSGEYNRKFTPEMAIDGDHNTCWMAAGGVGGSGNWIRFDFGREQTVSGIEFLNGNCWDGYYNGTKVASNLYRINGRIKQFTLTFSDGSTISYTADDVYETDFRSNVFVFDQPVTTSYIRLYVDSGYPGDKWDTVVCLAEFAAFQ